MPHRIREINPSDNAEIELVAARMRLTLQEVLGEERGREMYTMDWLIRRVRFHLDGECVGQVFVAEEEDGHIAGHTNVRLEAEDGPEIGLFSTIYVEPESRKLGIAKSLIARGEAWFLERNMDEAVTYTDEGNQKLHNLFISLGYNLTPMENQFVALSKRLRN